MAEYKIASMMNDIPRTWDGPNGTVYYIPVMLEGHDKPVSIGKKSPDALKQGDTVYGTIEPTEYNTDKFNAEQNPNYQGKQAYSGPKKSGFSPAERAKSADGQRHGMATNNANQYVIARGDLGLSPSEWADKVFEYAQALYAKGDLSEPKPVTQEQSALDALTKG